MIRILGKTVQTCNELCSYASSPFEQRICDYACDAIGLATFIKLLEEDGKDIDLIYLCELVKICPMEACTGKCMEIQSFKVNPNPVVIGSDINNIITVQEFKAWNGTGTSPIHIVNEIAVVGFCRIRLILVASLHRYVPL